MAHLSGLLGQWKPTLRRSYLGRSRVGQVILQGQTRRAYSFEVHHAPVTDAFTDVPAVYVYARKQACAAVGEKENGADYSVGFIGRTHDLGQRADEHARLGHFTGHAFDTLLILRIPHEAIRVDIERDLIDLYRPALNELLRSYQGAKDS
jgi:hypothetical protein